MLEPVTGITLSSINSTTVLISWSPPSTLEGVPILGYNVTITNTVTGENVQNFSTDVPSVQYSPAQNDDYLVAINKAGSGLPAQYYSDVLPCKSTVTGMCIMGFCFSISYSTYDE